jgi:Na+/H+ antiporter NhaD/arsenite permease-like protein
VRTRVDIEAALFLLALFIMVGAVSESGVFATAGRALASLPVAPSLRLALFLVLAAVVTIATKIFPHVYDRSREHKTRQSADTGCWRCRFASHSHR